MSEIAIKICNVSKEYRLGAIGGATLRGDLQSYWARIRKKDDPNLIIGQEGTRNQKFLALDHISFEVKKGERLGIIGHNGAGKSTLLKLLSRVTAPTSGTIAFNGRIASMLEVGTGFHPELTGRENVYMNGAILGMTKSEISKKFDEIVSFAEMEQFIDTPVKRYSSGMYVKLAFAVAAHLDSEIMVMDEVLAVGDMKFQQKCLGKMDNVAEHEGRTILYVSHNMNTIRQLCDRCIVLNRGKLIFNGAVEQAIEVYSNSTTQNFETDIDLSEKKRNYVSLGTIVKFDHFFFHNDGGCILNMGEEIKFSLIISSRVDDPYICFRTMIYYSDDMPVCMAGIKKGDMVISVGNNVIRGSINTSILASGTYHMKFALYRVNEYGTEYLLDVLDKAVYFQIKDGSTLNNMTWLHQYWGHINTDMKLYD